MGNVISHDDALSEVEFIYDSDIEYMQRFIELSV